METEDTPAIQWVKGLSQASRHFSAARQVTDLTVRVSLSDGSMFLAHRVGAGPGPTQLTIDVYPEDPDDDMVDGLDESGKSPMKRTPTAIFVDVRAITKVELLTEPPGEQQLGFAPPEDP